MKYFKIILPVTQPQTNLLC